MCDPSFSVDNSSIPGGGDGPSFGDGVTIAL